MTDDREEFLRNVIKKPRLWLENTGFPNWTPIGWLGLIVNLIEAIDREMTRFPDVHMNISQMKEKFGGLRFYYQLSENAPNELRDAIEALDIEAEDRSWLTCQTCGEPGLLRNHMGLLVTACDSHAPRGSRIAHPITRSKPKV